MGSPYIVPGFPVLGLAVFQDTYAAKATMCEAKADMFRGPTEIQEVWAWACGFSSPRKPTDVLASLACRAPALDHTTLLQDRQGS